MNQLQALIAALSRDRSLHEPARLRRRIEAIDRIEAHLLTGQDGAGSGEIPAQLARRASGMRARLEAINRRLYQGVRREIRGGSRPGSLIQWMSRSHRGSRQATRAAGEGYDYLDVLVNGVLRFELPGGEAGRPAAETAPYQPTPARHIFDLIARAGLTERDVLVDLGSGLGHVALLVSICTGASSIGIDRDEACVESARRCARSLNVTNARFIHQDARAADLSGGTAFYMYTPFSGTILRSVLDSLRREAARREIHIWTYGPCTAAVAREPWLKAVGTPRTNRPAMFRRRGQAVHNGPA